MQPPGRKVRTYQRNPFTLAEKFAEAGRNFLLSVETGLREPLGGVPMPRPRPTQIIMTEELSSFIASSFLSVWALELLLLLKQEPRQWSKDELITRLRASELVVTQAIGSLVAAGLVNVEEGGATYMPVSERLARLVDQTESLYSSKPDAVRRTIVTASSSGITAFADAFRLRKD